MSSKTDAKTIWLEEGLKTLATKGPGALSIEKLARATGKTKGSFYHHFNSREQYIEALLKYHENNTMDRIIEITSKVADSHTRREKLLKVTFQEISGDLELAIRAWALYDPMVRTFQYNLDRRRLDHIKEMHLGSGMTPDKAQLQSHRDYSLFIGLQQLRHHHNENEFRRILKKLFFDNILSH
jgi:AcrR family transcriptional regulator